MQICKHFNQTSNQILPDNLRVR